MAARFDSWFRSVVLVLIRSYLHGFPIHPNAFAVPVEDLSVLDLRTSFIQKAEEKASRCIVYFWQCVRMLSVKKTITFRKRFDTQLILMSGLHLTLNERNIIALTEMVRQA